jgi:hypothetical protein
MDAPVYRMNHRLPSMLRRRLASGLLALLIVATPVSAFFTDPCTAVGQNGIGFSPAHPGPNDTVTWVLSFNYGNSCFLTRSDVSGSQITLEEVVSCDASAFPSYYLSTGGALGTLGPLAPGVYTVKLRVLAYDAATHSTTTVCEQSNPSQLSITAVPGPTTRVEVVEFYNHGLDHYFITAYPAEIQDLDHGVHPGWDRTGQSFFAYAAGGSDGRGQGVQRVYGRPEAGLNTHFYSWYGPELGALDEGPSGEWILETDDAFETPVPASSGVCPTDTLPVYRLWNDRFDTNHRYTTKLEIKKQMLALGYVPEGFGQDAVFMCAIK